MPTTTPNPSTERTSPAKLTVRSDNLNAKALYERMGFQTEGVKRRAFLVDGEYHDAYAMAMLREDDAQPIAAPNALQQASTACTRG